MTDATFGRDRLVLERLEPGVRMQYGALPYRWTAGGDLQILLITSRTRRRWIVPKGWPMKGRKPWETAEIEAREEAGVAGVVAKRAVGSFHYDKILDEDDRVLACEVTIFPLLVERCHKSWREKKQRETRWVSPAQAAALAADAGLRTLIAAFGASHGPSGSTPRPEAPGRR
jgi:8-oxo-dGTP pyrophosphatase MutT (NUDIX family)